MKKIINLFSILVLMPFMTYHLFADTGAATYGTTAGEFIKVGAAGGQFLKIGIGARANGMAGAVGSMTNDLTSIFWNPAGLADVKGISTNFSYTQWFGTYSHNFAALSLPLSESFIIAGSYTALSSDKIEITTMSQPEGTGTTYSVSDMALGLTLGGYLTQQFSFGVTAKYISNSFSSEKATGVAFDIGTMYNTGIQGIKLGFSIHNLGTEESYSGQDLKSTAKPIEQLNANPLDMEYLSTSFSIPIIFRAGASTEIINDEMNKLVAAIDFMALSDTPNQYAIGAEYTWNNLVAVRGGYRIGQDQFSIAGGLGLNYDAGAFAGQLDYAISPTKDLGIVHRLTINLLVK